MQKALKNVARACLPPLVWNGARAAWRRVRRPAPPRSPGPAVEPGKERDAAWYDELFATEEHLLAHYTHSHYYFLWCVVVDRVRRAGAQSILDVGCGAGQLAAFLRDAGVPRYVGLDFSPARVAQAREVCPEYRFVVEDVFRTDLLETLDYDTVLSTEFMEHVERDLEVLDRIRPGTRTFLTVPNFPAPAHVRHFRSAEEVAERYGSRFEACQVDTFQHRSGMLFHLLEGVRAAAP